MSCEDPPDDYCTTITSNPDISGIGVRVAIYVQTLLSMTVASYLPYHETAFRDTSRNTYVVSTSLMIASIIQWKTGDLSLFDALIVTMLTTIMTAFVTVNAPYIRTLGLSVNISSFLFTAFWCYWGLQVWANPVSFGLPDGKGPAECDASAKTIFVAFGKNVSVQNSGLRGFAIFVFGIVIIVAISTFCQSVVWSLRYLANGPSAAKDAAAQRLAKKLHWERTHRRSRKEHVTRFGGLAGLIYMIVTTEQIVARNPDVSSSSSLSDWTYSQTIALIMLGQQIMECIGYFKEEIIYRRQRRALANGDTA